MLHPIIAAQPVQFWTEAIFFLVMGFLWLVNRIAAGVEAARRPPPRRPPQGMPPQGMPPQGGGPQAQQMQPRQLAPPQAQPRPAGDALQNEIEEFLRRAAGRREGPRQPGAAQPQRPALGRPATTGTKPDPRRGRTVPVVVRTKPAASEPAEGVETPQAISQHVKQYLDVREFDQRSSKLSSIDEQERQFEQKLQQTFTHEVGHLKRSTLADGGDSAATAAAVQQISPKPNILIGLMRSGIDLKRAIALNEIFQRPEHRW